MKWSRVEWSSIKGWKGSDDTRKLERRREKQEERKEME